MINWHLIRFNILTLLVLSFSGSALAFDAVSDPFSAVIDGTGDEWIHHMVADDEGNLYVAGAYNSAAQNGLAKLISSTMEATADYSLPAARGLSNAFVAKLNANGEFQWIAHSSGGAEEVATGLGFDRNSGKLLVSGYFSGAAVPFGTHIISPIDNATGVDAGAANLFVAVINPDNGLWLDVEPMPLEVQINGTAPTNPIKNLHIRTGEYASALNSDQSVQKQIMGRALALGAIDQVDGTAIFLKGLLNSTSDFAAQTRIKLGAGNFRPMANNGEWGFVVKVNVKENLTGDDPFTWKWRWNSPVNSSPEVGSTSAITTLIADPEQDQVFWSGYWRGNLTGPGANTLATASGDLSNGFVGAMDTATGAVNYVSTVGGVSAVHSIALAHPHPDNDPDPNTDTATSQAYLVAVGEVRSVGAQGGAIDLTRVSSSGVSTPVQITVPDWPAGVVAGEQATQGFMGRLRVSNGDWAHGGLITEQTDGSFSEQHYRLHDVEVGRDGSIYAAGSVADYVDMGEMLPTAPTGLKIAPSSDMVADVSCDGEVESWIWQYPNGNVIWPNKGRLNVSLTIESPNGVSETDTLCFTDGYCEPDQYGLITSASHFQFENPTLLQELSSATNLGENWQFRYSLELQGHTKAWTSQAYSGNSDNPDDWPYETTNISCAGSITIPAVQSFLIDDSGNEIALEGAIFGDSAITDDNLNLSIAGTGPVRKQVLNNSSPHPGFRSSFYSTIKTTDPAATPSYAFDFEANSRAIVAKTKPDSQWLNSVVPLEWNNQSTATESQTSHVGELALNNLQTLYSSTGLGVEPELTGSNAATAEEMGLIARWMFDEGQGAIANDFLGVSPLSLNNIDWDQDRHSNAGKSIKFNGVGSFGEVGYPLVDTAASFSITGWIKLNDNNQIQGIFSQDGNYYSGFWLHSDSRKGGKFALVMYPTDSSGGSGNQRASTAVPNLGQWYHLTAVRDKAANELRIYLDGELQETASWNGGWVSNGSFLLGRTLFQGNPVYRFTGNLDEVSVYTQALTNSQVSEIYQQSLTAGSEPAPTTPVSGSPSFSERLQGLNAQGAVISAFNPETGEILQDFLNYRTYKVGDWIEPPAGAQVPSAANLDYRLAIGNDGVSLTTPANLNANGEPLQQIIYQASFNNQWYAAGVTDGGRVLWPTLLDPVNNKPPLIGRAIKIRWPTLEEGLGKYNYGEDQFSIPDVDLNPEQATDTFNQLLYSENLARDEPLISPVVTITTGDEGAIQSLTTTESGFVSLLFHAKGDLTGSASEPRIVALLARHWLEDNSLDNAVVGEEVTPPADAMTGKTGYPMTALSKHDTNPAVYDPDTRIGQIVPINLDNDPTKIEDDDLVVAWYRQDESNREWPFRNISYSLSWPSDADTLVIASQKCTAGLGAENIRAFLNPSSSDSTLSEYQLYIQNDPSLPGFNPNEEHGLLTDYNSQADSETVACALRNDLAVQTRGPCDNDPATTNVPACYSSDPYLIVKALSTPADTSLPATWEYKLAKVELFNSNYPGFVTPVVEAGNKIIPPFPLDKGAFQSPQTFGTGDAFWVDVNGQVWGRSAGPLIAQYYYPANPAGQNYQFFIDVDGDGINDADSIGDIPWLSKTNASQSGYSVARQPSTDQVALVEDGVEWQSSQMQAQSGDLEPIEVLFNVSWPLNLSSLSIGDTLTFAKGGTPTQDGLPDIQNMAAIDIIYDQADEEGDETTSADDAPIWDQENAKAIPSINRHETASIRVFNYVAAIGQDPCFISQRDCGDIINGQLQVVDLPIHGDVETIILPANKKDGKFYFPDLPAHLRYRVFFNPDLGGHGEFTFEGGNFHVKTAKPLNESAPGERLVLINVMNASERDILKLLDNDDRLADEVDDKPDSDWDKIVDALYQKTRNPKGLDLDGDGTADDLVLAGFEIDPGQDSSAATQIQHQQATTKGSALTAAFATKPGYVAIAENNVVGSENPVNVHVFKIAEPRARGALRVLHNDDNVLDEKLVIRHDLDFGGRDGMTFEWWWRPAVGDPGNETLSLDCQGRPLSISDGCPDPNLGWKFLGETSDNSLVLRSGDQILADGYMLARYKGLPVSADENGDDWIGYAGLYGTNPPDIYAVLTEGWVKRVLTGVNGFEENFDPSERAPVVYSSFLVQAGEPYQGPVALNGDSLQNVGLIELYQTVLNRATGLSVDAGEGSGDGGSTNDDSLLETAINQQLLYASNRLAELSMLLGDEAFSDAQDPTIGISEVGGNATYLSPNRFAFDPLLNSLLSEELALMRGLEKSDPHPRFNRLAWNIDNDEGTAVYKQVYGMSSVSEDSLEAAAQAAFPQGHGDALGYYLDATKYYYRLLKHPNYEWTPLTEARTIGGVPVQVDYADEQNFARAAAKKARTIARVLDLTYRQQYKHNPADQWGGYADTNPDRRWGVDGWARRGAQGAFLDYVLGNALLEPEDPEFDPATDAYLDKIDRQTVTQINEITKAYLEIESIIELVDRGRNPLGLSADAIPFDISPFKFENEGKSHFEQIYERAIKANENALQVFNYANDLTQAIRANSDDQVDLLGELQARELEFKHRLVELFGYPYAGDIGPGKTYPPSYDGPDVYHFNYLDYNAIEGQGSQGLVPDSIINTETFVPSFTISEKFDSAYKKNQDLYTISFVPIDVINEDAEEGTYDQWFDTDPNATIDIDYPYTTTGDYAFVAPEPWGRRKAAGEIQLALMDMVRLEARLKSKLAEQSATIERAEDRLKLLEAQFSVTSQSIAVRDRLGEIYAKSRIAAITINQAKEVVNQLGELYYRAKKTSSECVGGDRINIGLSQSIPNVYNCVTSSVTTHGLIYWYLTGSYVLSAAQTPAEIAASIANFAASTTFENQEVAFDVGTLLTEIDAELSNEQQLRYQVAEIAQELEIASGNYKALVAKGARVLEEREAFRLVAARDTTDARYRDYVYRIFRNEGLQKYSASFDLAARYTYLAAKAFDYETGLLSGEPEDGFLDSIIQQRSLGQFNDASPQGGGLEGLSDSLAKLYAAYEALPNGDGYDQDIGFSLRKEMLRIPLAATYDNEWQQALTAVKVQDVLAIPEFRRYAKLSNDTLTGAPVPGFVVRFGTEVNFLKNFFGWPLSGGESNYSSSYSATKIKRVGVEFINYDGANALTATPYVYLLPVGTDILRTPTDNGLIRQYYVLEQALPVPVSLVDSGGYQDSGWIPLIDGFQGQGLQGLDRWDAIRKHPQIQAAWTWNPGSSSQPPWVYADPTSSGAESSRLLGRSVWNSEWMLVIFGLLSDQEEGLRRFINGDGSCGNVDGFCGVSDIKLHLKTYSVE